MTLPRRAFVSGLAAATLTRPDLTAFKRPVPPPSTRGFDPWLEVDPAALAYNVGVLARLAGGRSILAVVKNNAYGLGLTTAATALEPLPEIRGFAVVKTEAALALRDAGIRKPVLLMAVFSEEDGPELVRRGIQLALTDRDAARRAAAAAVRAGGSVHGHVYLDTGMSRMGIPYHQAMPVLEDLANHQVVIESTYMGFTEDSEFDREQLRRFRALADEASGRGVSLGHLHAASSNAVFNFPESHLDFVRPGISLYGAYPSDYGKEREIAELRSAVRLRAGVVRVERLRTGDSVSYGRQYVADKPTWIATLPVGHTDGYPREAVQGAKVLIGDGLYPVIGAVSASHTIIEVGEERTVEVGDVATLLGPDHPAIHPNGLAESTGRSVYDVLMHLNPGLPKHTA